MGRSEYCCAMTTEPLEQMPLREQLELATLLLQTLGYEKATAEFNVRCARYAGDRRVARSEGRSTLSPAVEESGK